MKLNWCVMLVVVGGVVFTAGCGKEEKKGGAAVPASQDQPTAPAGGAAVESESGEALAKEILAAFDEVVAKAAELAEGRPEADELLPKLEALYSEYEDVMKAFNERYLLLLEQSPSEFGQANGYLAGNRGKHAFAKDTLLGPTVAYYNFEKGEQEVVAMLSRKSVALLDVAVKR